MNSTSLDSQVDKSFSGAAFASPDFFRSDVCELPPVHPALVGRSLIASAERAASAEPRKLALSEAERHRLVEASKSRTRLKVPKSEHSELPYFRQKAECLKGQSPFFVGPVVHTREMVERDPQTVDTTEAYGPGKYTVISYREWSDEYRVRTRVDVPAEAPQAPEGERVSFMLTDRGARAIADSCHYMALKKGGYQTFFTATFRPEKREAIANGETTIQREVTRMMDAMKKMFLRGWETKNKDKIPPAGNEFCYCWVVEVPANEHGEENPHVHIMMNWGVPFSLFHEWAKRIERIWGQGFAHLEKIKEPEHAGAYMAKAAGYMSKANGASDQGRVKGNRYGISKPARAPGWCSLGDYELGVMGSLITELSEHIERKYRKDREERAKLSAARKKATKKKDRKRIGAKLAAVREKLKAVGVIAGKYQAIFKGSENFTKFLGWAGAAGWDSSHRPDSIWITEFRRQQLERKKRSRVNWLAKCFDEFRDSLEMMGDLLSVYADEISGLGSQPKEAPDWGEYEQLNRGLM